MKKPSDSTVVLVAGAPRGIDNDVAPASHKQGARLVLTARSAHRPTDEIRALGAEALTVPTDVASHAPAAALMDAPIQRFGTIDVLVDNAGWAGWWHATGKA